MTLFRPAAPRLDQLHLLRQFDHPRRGRPGPQVIRPDRHRRRRLGFARVEKEAFPEGQAEEVRGRKSEVRKEAVGFPRLTSDL
jgi:hypothetical protein